MSGMSIRSSTAEDLPAIWKVFRRAALSNEGDRPWIEALTTLAAHEIVPARNWTELPRLVPALGTPAAEAPPSKYTLYEEVTEFLRLASAAQPLTVRLAAVEAIEVVARAAREEAAGLRRPGEERQLRPFVPR